jgi:hypothetical protein
VGVTGKHGARGVPSDAHDSPIGRICRHRAPVRSRFKDVPGRAASLQRQAPELEYARYACTPKKDCAARVGRWRNSGSKLRMRQAFREHLNGKGSLSTEKFSNTID